MRLFFAPGERPAALAPARSPDAAEFFLPAHLKGDCHEDEHVAIRHRCGGGARERPPPPPPREPHPPRAANVPAHAAILSNGAQQNGLTAKALNPNALNPNALKANAITTNAAVGGGSSLGDLNGVRLEGAEPGR